MMNLALQRIDALQDKPMFIERVFLERLIQQSGMCTVPEVPIQEPQIDADHPRTRQPITTNSDEAEFYHMQETYPQILNILEDATGKLIQTAH